MKISKENQQKKNTIKSAKINYTEEEPKIKEDLKRVVQVLKWANFVIYFKLHFSRNIKHTDIADMPESLSR